MPTFNDLSSLKFIYNDLYLTVDKFTNLSLTNFNRLMTEFKFQKVGIAIEKFSLPQKVKNYIANTQI